MDIVIVGGGLVGSNLAAKLAGDGHDVSLVERDERLVRELSGTLDVRLVAGDGASAAVLRQAGVESAEVVVATTDSDEVNMVVGLVAGSMFDVGRIVVRLRDPDHVESFSAVRREHSVDYAFVTPNEAAVQQTVSLLKVPGALDVATFLDGRLWVAGFRVREGSDFAGLLVSHVELMFAGEPTLVVAIHRDSDWIIPHGADELRAGDLVYFAMDESNREAVRSLVGAAGEDGRTNIMIAGAGTLGLALARRLEAYEGKVIVLESRLEVAQRAAELLPHAVVVHGSATERTLLEEEDVERVDAFVALTESHETNLVSGLLAKRLGAARAFALVDNPALVEMIGEVGVDAVISPRLLAIGQILRHVHGGSVTSVAPLLEDRVEIVEAEAVAGSRLVSAPLAELRLPRGVLVAALRRGGEIRLPRGEDQVAPGDVILLITAVENAGKMGAWLEAQ